MDKQPDIQDVEFISADLKSVSDLLDAIAVAQQHGFCYSEGISLLANIISDRSEQLDEYIGEVHKAVKASQR